MNRYRTRFLFGILLVLLLFGSVQAELPKGWTSIHIQYTVKDSISKTPLSGAKISMAEYPKLPLCETDKSGLCRESRIDNSQELHSVTVTVTKEGYYDWSQIVILGNGSIVNQEVLMTSKNPVVTTSLPTSVQTIRPITIAPSGSGYSSQGTGLSDPSGLTSPIIFILVFVVLASGGIGIYLYRRKNLRSDGQPPASSTTAENSPNGEDIPCKITAAEQKASSLALFETQARVIITQAIRQYRSAAYDDARATLSTAEQVISSLKKYETQLAQWKSEGYDITPLENLKRGDIATINSAFRNFEQEIKNHQTSEQLRNQSEYLSNQANNVFSSLQQEGAIMPFSLDPIRQKVDQGNYNDAIIAAEKAIEELTRIRELYKKAKVLKTKVTDPRLISLFESGRYEDFIRSCEQRQEDIRKVAELEKKGKKLLAQLEQFCNFPDDLRIKLGTKLETQDIPAIENAISKLETFSETAKPELVLTLGHTQLSADDWDRMTLHLENQGNAHANNVRLTFSDEFDTRRIKPVTINAGATISLEIGIRPKVKGKVPLEVTVLYHDGMEREYHDTQEFWIEVLEKSITMPPGTPVSPVGRFAPGPLTPRQLPPDLFDHYTDSEFIGKGGFARVFKAKRKDGKIVAVKIPISMDATTGRSFIAEMQNWTKLSHPNIVQLYDFNIMPMPYFEEELCEGSLADQVKPIESQGAAWILFNICEGLKFAHDHKIIHRDLKPQNILLKNGIPKISDWGLSRIISESTTTTSTSFTPYYAAPEQIQNKSKDKRTDIWQLGVILYELITGTLPFTGDSMVEIGMSIATKDPKYPGEINTDAKKMDSVVMKCLEKDPAKRYQSVIELQRDLAVILKIDYKESLNMSGGDSRKMAIAYGKSFLTQLKIGELHEAYKDLLDLIHCSKGGVKTEAQELSEQIKMRIENGFTEVPEELIQKAEIIVHKASMGFGNKR